MIRSRLRAVRRRLRRLREQLLGRLYGVIVGVATEQPLIALTFDDGPDPVTTPAVLDILARHGARATFFMVGDAARRHPDIAATVAAAGHAVAHHTLEHVSLPGLGREEVRRQIVGGFEAIGPTCERLFRPPWGHLDRVAFQTARRAGNEVVAWSGHAFDWTSQDASSLTERLRATLAPGAIVLLHDARQRCDAEDGPRAELLLALDAVLAASKHTWRFVSLPELLAAGRPQRETRWRTAPPNFGA